MEGQYNGSARELVPDADPHYIVESLLDTSDQGEERPEGANTLGGLDESYSADTFENLPTDTTKGEMEHNSRPSCPPRQQYHKELNISRKPRGPPGTAEAALRVSSDTQATLNLRSVETMEYFKFLQTSGRLLPPDLTDQVFLVTSADTEAEQYVLTVLAIDKSCLSTAATVIQAATSELLGLLTCVERDRVGVILPSWSVQHVKVFQGSKVYSHLQEELGAVAVLKVHNRESMSSESIPAPCTDEESLGLASSKPNSIMEVPVAESTSHMQVRVEARIASESAHATTAMSEALRSILVRAVEWVLPAVIVPSDRSIREFQSLYACLLQPQKPQKGAVGSAMRTIKVWGFDNYPEEVLCIVMTRPPPLKDFESQPSAKKEDPPECCRRHYVGHYCSAGDTG